MSVRLAVAALVLLSAAATAQSRVRIAEGRVLRPEATGDPVPVRGQWVVLHRVGSDSAGPLDSVRTGANGRFRFRFEPWGSPDALYFVSATYGGIAYFSPPLRSAVASGGDADILVHETTNDTSSLRVQGRHIVVSQSRGRNREIAEIFEIENQSPRTVTARDTVPVWTAALPEAAESLSVAPGDVSAAAVTFTPGRVALFAPLSPGVRQLVLLYRLPNDAFPVSFPMQRQTSVLEVLLEDPRGGTEGVALREVDAATIEGRTFRRLLGQDVPANAVLRIDMPAPPGHNTRMIATVIGAVAALMLLGAALWFARRRRAPAVVGAPAPVAAASEVDRIVAELAAMDARHERSPARDAAAESEYRRQRAELKAQLERALARDSHGP